MSGLILAQMSPSKSNKTDSKELRSRIMRAVKHKDSAIELHLRRSLYSLGLRFRKHYKIPGTPDIAFTKYRVAIFCDSEFWHGKDWEIRKSDIKSNHEYWYKKIEENIARDRLVDEQLKLLGWIVLRFWGKDIVENTDNCLAIILKTLSDRGLALKGKMP